MPSSITYLAIPSPKKALRFGVDVVRHRLDQLRRSHLLRRSRRTRSARAALVNAATRAAQPATAVIHKISRLLRPLFKARRSPAAGRASAIVSRLVGTLQGSVLRSRAVSAVGRAVRSVLKHARALLPTKLRASLSFLLHTKHRRRRTLRWIFHYAALAVALSARIRRRRQRRVLSPLLAASTITSLVNQCVVALAARIVADRELQRKQTCVARMEKAWVAWKERRRHRRQRRQRLLDLLSTAHNDLVLAEAKGRLVETVAARMAHEALLSVCLELARRRAALSIQRVWRGSCARARVYKLLSAKKRKAYLKRQRERVRLARTALLAGTEQDLEQKRIVARRVAARQEKTKPPRDLRVLRREMAHCRTSMLEPIMCHDPPRVSVATGARVIPVSFAKFDKICQRHARVNPNNLWVAIPVAYNEISSQESVHGKFLKTTFDWVPATLLSADERSQCQ